MPSSQDFTVFADYFQYVLMDEASEDDFSTIWTEEALKRMLAVGNGALCPGTLRNVEVAVQIVLHEQEPAMNLAECDHAVEASIHIPSGRLVVMSCTGYLPDAPRVAVQSGTYRILSVATGIDSIKNEWEPAEDKYVVHLWLGEAREPRLLKHWKPSDA